MDATQAIDFSDDEECEEETEPGQKKAIAYLQVLAQKDLSASKHPIYEGENFIGRHESNSIHMPYKALSKQHACIEVQGNSHLIYDMESRNKTRRGKMFLKANVRYELRDDDNLTFGDVKCQYIIQPHQDDDDDETGSETDSELMLQLPDSEDTGQEDKYCKDDENENESSFNLNDFLQPTQPCVQSPKLEFKTPRRLDQGKVYAADSDEESPNNSNFSRVEESDSDTDIDETGPFDISALASAQTQAALATQAVDNIETQAVDNMATLAVDNVETQAVDNMETQAVENMETQAIDNMATLAVDNMETQAVDNMATLAVDNMETQAVDNMATLAVDNVETQAVDSLETQAIDNMATQAVDNMATQAVDYSADSDSSDTDIDEVRQSLLEAPTQAVRPNDSRHNGTPKKYNQTLVLDSSSASSDEGDSPVKQAGRGRNIYDEPTQVCDGIVSDSGSETDIEEGGMEAETQAVMRDEDDKIDEMATVAICQEDDEDEDVTDDEGTMETKRPDSDKTGNVEDMATVPIAMDDDDDDTDIGDSDDEGVKGVVSEVTDAAKVVDVENMATIPIPMADDDDDDTDVEEGNMAAMKGTETEGTSEVTKEDAPKVAPANTDQETDNTEIESETGEASQEYFLNYRSEGNTAEKEDPGPCEVEATQPYGGASEDAGSEDAPSSNHGDDAVFDATQPYGGNEDETPKEPTTASSVTMEMSSTQPYGERENKQPGLHDDDETDPTVPYGAEGDAAMETGDSEIESTQAYGMQGGDTQIPDSQDGDDQAAPSSRFPVFKTQSPSRSCLKQPNTPERKTTKARRVTFGPGDEEDESDGEQEASKSGRQSKRQPKGSKSSAAPEQQSTSTGARRGGSRVSQRAKDKELDAAISDNAIGCQRSTRGNTESNEVAAKPGQKRKVGVIDPALSESSAPTITGESSAKRGKRQRGGKAEEEPDGGLGSVDELVTMTDAKPTRKKEFDAENPRPSSRRGSKVKDERKLSNSSISSVGSEGSMTGRALQTIVQIGKKLTRISKRGKRSSEDSEQRATVSTVVETRRSQRTSEIVDDGDSDDMASLSSTASSVRDFTEVEPNTRPTRGSRKQKGSKKVIEENDGPVTSGARRSRRGGGGAEKEETADVLVSYNKSGSRSKSRGVAMKAMETEVDGQSVGCNSRMQKRGAKGDEKQSQGDDEIDVSKRVGMGETTESQNDGEVKSKRTKRGKTPDVKPDTQDKEPVGRKVELSSKPVKSSTRGKTKTKTSGDRDQGVQEETSVHDEKESQDTTSRSSRRATSESQEESTKETDDANVRQSGRRRTMPARFLDSKGNEKTTASQKQEAKDTSSTDDGVFTVPKAVGRSSRKKQQKEPSSSSPKEVESETVQTSTRGRRSTATTPQAYVEKGKPEPVAKDRESSKKGQRAAAVAPGTSSSIEKSQAEENTATPATQRGRRATAKISETVEKEKTEDVKDDTRESSKREKRVAMKTDASSSKEALSVPESTPTQRGRRAATKTSESSVEKGKSEDVKEGSSNISKRGKQVAATKHKPAEESAADKSMETPAIRGRRAIISSSSTKKNSGESERMEPGTEEEKTAEVPKKTRGKRGATATPPPSSPAKKPRQATLPASQSSPCATPPPAKKPRQATLPTSQSSPSASPSSRRSREHQTDQMSLSPSLRRRVSDARPKVMFTGVMDASWQKTVTTLGGELVDSVHHCTHLITDKVRRTVKFLCCVARGVIILTPNWLDESKAKKMFVDPVPYQLKDKASERQHGFTLPVSLQKAGEARLLTGYKIHVTSGVKPEPLQMKDIIKCAGGEYVAKLPTKSVPQMVVVSCDGDKSLWAGPTKAGIPVVSSEFILTGILRQEILLKDYKLK